MFEELKNSYTRSHLTELEKLEQYFHFESFGQSDVLALSEQIIACSRDMGEIAFRVIRESDQLVVFQYVDDGRSERNLDFAMMKRNCTLKTGHMSCWALVKDLAEGAPGVPVDPKSGCLPVAGAFPIFSAGKHTYTVCISGLKDGGDFHLMLQALSRHLGIEALHFSGPMV